MPRKSKDLTPAGARNSALRTLGRREHSAEELKAKLQVRGFDEETVAQTVSSLSEKGWQSDGRYAEQLLRSRIAQGYGPLRIEAEMSAAGIGDAEVSAAMGGAECDWLELALQVHQRKFRAAPAGAADWQKHYRYLASRGFTTEQIHAVLRHEPEAD